MKYVKNICQELTIEELEDNNAFIELMTNAAYRKGAIVSINKGVFRKNWRFLMNRVRTLLKPGDKVVCTTIKTKEGYVKLLEKGKEYTIKKTKMSSHGLRHVVYLEEVPGYYYSSKRFKKLYK